MLTVGEEVLLMDHLGSFLVEEIDVERKTAALRRLGTYVLIKDVDWNRIWPLDDKIRELIAQLRAETPIQLLRQMVDKRNERN